MMGNKMTHKSQTQLKGYKTPKTSYSKSKFHAVYVKHIKIIEFLMLFVKSC